MTFWEFLIQKEGDRSWLPLESPDVEVLEGRYRVVARSGRVNCPVEIRVVHISPETSPVRRVQKRSGQTNQDGLIVVIPYTRLLPGAWELRCSSDILLEMMGETWQYGVQLQVLPQDLEVADWPTAAPEDVQPADSDAPESLEVPPSPLASAIDAAPPAAEPEPSLMQQAEEAINAALQEMKPAQPQDVALRLTLDRTMHVIRQGQSLKVSGRVEGSTGALPQLLRIVLQDPQTAEAVIDRQYQLLAVSLPLMFTQEVALPDCGSHLLLGEVMLCGDSGETVLASQPFNVTIDLDVLLETLAEESANSDVPPPPEFASEADAASLDLNFLQRVATPPTPARFQLSSSSLPPQLHPTAEQPRVRSPQLPSFSPPATPDPVSDEPLEPAEIAEAVRVDQPVPIRSEVPGAASRTVEPQTADLDIGWEGISQWQYSSAPQPSNTPEEAEFKALKLHDRFWVKLQSLATDAELSRRLQNLSSGSGERSTQLEYAGPARSPDADLTAREVVVEDEGCPRSGQAAVSVALPPSDAEDPPPPPQLNVPAGELTAGNPVMVTVQLPYAQSRLFVKLWMHDPQTRSLLDGPRWLVDLLPDGLGSSLAQVQLVVPHGCTQVRFEAVSVEMTTQRESDKATIDREVVPANLPPLSLENLEEV